MDVDVAQTAAAVVPYLTAAVQTYGLHTLDKLRDDAVDATTDATVGLAHRLVGRLLGRAESWPAVEAAIGDLTVAPDDADTVAALRLQIRKALGEDPELCADIVRMLAGAGLSVVASGPRSVAAHTITGVVATGDDATVQR